MLNRTIGRKPKTISKQNLLNLAQNFSTRIADTDARRVVNKSEGQLACQQLTVTKRTPARKTTMDLRTYSIGEIININNKVLTRVSRLECLTELFVSCGAVQSWLVGLGEVEPVPAVAFDRVVKTKVRCIQ